ncbi:MAG: transposase [bacterium]|nr:transposase [bacterium]
MSNQKKQSTEAAGREIRRRSRRKFSPEEKIRIVREGLRGEQSVADLGRREGIASNLYYRWSKDFLEAGQKQLAGDTVRELVSSESAIFDQGQHGPEPLPLNLLEVATKIASPRRSGERCRLMLAGAEAQADSATGDLDRGDLEGMALARAGGLQGRCLD